MAGTSNRCEFVGFATGHFVYISFAIHGSYYLLQEWINSEQRLNPEAQARIILGLARRVCTDV